MYVLALRVDLHLPHCRSLKDKRAVVRPIVDGLRGRFDLAAAEVAHQDKWQRAALGVAAVGESVRHTTQVIDEAERFVWSRPDIEVLAADRHWLDSD